MNFYKFPIAIPNARQWTPEEPWLYQAQVKLLNEDGQVTDARSRQFGMRWFVIDEDCEPKGMPRLNGQEIRLRGANTMGNEQQCVMKGDFDQLRKDLLLAKAANMNFLRFTQRPVQTEVYEFCDRLGIMAQTDLPLFAHLRRNQFSEAVRQSVEMERHVRAHTCNILVSYINEPFPEEWRKMNHRRLARPDLERFFLAATEAIRVENPDRVVKPVDGDYDPPTWGLPDNHCYTYWYLGHAIDQGKLHKGFWTSIKPGWNYGCGEFGAEGMDTLELLEKYCPKDWLPNGPDDSEWSPEKISKAQAWKMGEMFFDKPDTAQGWIDETRAHQAFAMKQMTEAFRRDERNVSCAIHLFIDAWPTGWMKTIMDVDRNPKPAYFTYRDALTPLMVSLRTDRLSYEVGDTISSELWVCNDTHQKPKDPVIKWQLEDESSKVIHAESFQVDIALQKPVCHGTLQFSAPDVTNRSEVTLKAALFDGEQKVHENTLVFKVSPKVTYSKPRVHALGANAESILAQIDGEVDADAGVILCSGYDNYKQDCRNLLDKVKSGATLVIIDLANGDYDIEGSSFSVKETSMAPRFFVSRKTGHPLVEGFEKDDFNHWYHTDLDRMAPLLKHCIEADGWNAIVKTTDQNCFGPAGGGEAHAVMEKSLGEGRVIVCNLLLDGFVTHNAAAKQFAVNMLSPLVGHVEEAGSQLSELVQ